MSALPKRVRVLGPTYVIGYDRGKPAELDDRVSRGLVDLRAGRIHVDGTMPFEQQRLTLIHEVLHAIDFQTGGVSESLEERSIKRLAAGVDCVFSQNPKLVALYNGPAMKKRKSGKKRC